jgi:hypothetical protein
MRNVEIECAVSVIRRAFDAQDYVGMTNAKRAIDAMVELLPARSTD